MAALSEFAACAVGPLAACSAGHNICEMIPMSDALYEYGIAGRHTGPAVPHRTGMTEDEAREWVRESEEDFVPGAFYVIRRRVGEWERGDTDE